MKMNSLETGSVKVVLVTAQIVTSIAWNVNIEFPSPFSHMLQVFSICSLDFLNLDCLAGNYLYSIIIWSFIPMVLAFGIALIDIGRMMTSHLLQRHRHHHAQQSDLTSGGGGEGDEVALFQWKWSTTASWLVLFLSYITVPLVMQKQLRAFDW
jgi:hypothetical protein